MIANKTREQLFQRFLDGVRYPYSRWLKEVQIEKEDQWCWREKVAFEQLGRGEESCVAMIERFQMGLMKRSGTYRAEESFPTPSARPYKA